MISSGGSWISARARLTRCFMPLLNDLSIFSRMPVRLVKSSICSIIGIRLTRRSP